MRLEVLLDFLSEHIDLLLRLGQRRVSGTPFEREVSQIDRFGTLSQFEYQGCLGGA